MEMILLPMHQLELYFQKVDLDFHYLHLQLIQLMEFGHTVE